MISKLKPYSYIAPKNHQMGTYYTLSYWKNSEYEKIQCSSKGIEAPKFWLRLL